MKNASPGEYIISAGIKHEHHPWNMSVCTTKEEDGLSVISIIVAWNQCKDMTSLRDQV